MIDIYSKIVLTVIAVSLCALVIQNFAPSASAFGQSNCGSRFSPCKIQIEIKGDLDFGHSGNVSVYSP